MSARKPRSYADWREAVDIHLLVYCGLTTDALPDATWDRWFYAGIPAATAARKGMREAQRLMS